MALRVRSSANLPSVDGELGFQGGATFYQDGSKVLVDVRRYFATDTKGVPNRWWGKYEIADGATLASGVAYARFSDHSECDIAIDAADERTGRFVVQSQLVDSTHQSLG
jgi:hypothetical protein